MRVLTFLLAAVSLLAFSAASWAAYPLGVEVYGGYDFPVIQEDVGPGSMFGVAVRGNIWKVFHGEVAFRSTSQGDAEKDAEFGDVTETIKFAGGTLSGFGFNLLIASKEPKSFWPYFHLGVSSNSLSKGESFLEDETLTGMSGGLGTGINLYQKKVYLDFSTGLLVMPFHDDKASRKNWQTRLGIQYFIPIKGKSGGEN
jgi:hypothetical protein